MSTLGQTKKWLYYRGWLANTGPNTCYGEILGPINQLLQYYRGWPANTGPNTNLAVL